MKQGNIAAIISGQRLFFTTNITKNVDYRIEQLKKLKSLLHRYESAIIDALQHDLAKPSFEAYTSEVMLCIQEIEYALAHIHAWSRLVSTRTPITLWPMRSAVLPEPYGVVLIISTWNYPFNLSLIPLIGAIAAGNCAIIKPSPRALHSAALLAKIINDHFDAQYMYVVCGGDDVLDKLLEHQWDYLFATGGRSMAKRVMQNAAEHITPVTLELGGKSPCIVDHTVSIDRTAKKITWAKWMNAGQNCTAPDYLLVHASIRDALMQSINKYLTKFYGDNPAQSPDYARIIDVCQFNRLVQFLQNAQIIVGGTTDVANKYIAPTIIEVNNLDHPALQEEIFGPILPVITFETIDQAITVYKKNPDPLAVYLFSRDTAVHTQVQLATRSGALGINELMLQVASPHLPFGGVGSSGFGRYHGKASFDTFSHYRSIVRASWFEIPFRYPPYTRWARFISNITRWF